MANETPDYSSIARKRSTKTPEGTPMVETTYADGYVSERFFKTRSDADRFAA